MTFFSSFFKELLGDAAVYAVVIFLFVFYYFVVPDYWFLCSFFTIIAWGAFRIFISARSKKS